MDQAVLIAAYVNHPRCAQEDLFAVAVAATDREFSQRRLPREIKRLLALNNHVRWGSLSGQSCRLLNHVKIADEPFAISA